MAKTPTVAERLVPAPSRPKMVGPRITAMRETLNLSKAQLADSIDLDRSTMSKIENGKMGLDIAKATRIAETYGFGLNYIYRGDVSDTPDRLRPALLVQMVTARAR